eukprot:2448970-Lingulodinium_polyedra.AAC.1
MVSGNDTPMLLPTLPLAAETGTISASNGASNCGGAYRPNDPHPASLHRQRETIAWETMT